MTVIFLHKHYFSCVNVDLAIFKSGFFFEIMKKIKSGGISVIVSKMQFVILFKFSQ